MSRLRQLSFRTIETSRKETVSNGNGFSNRFFAFWDGLAGGASIRGPAGAPPFRSTTRRRTGCRAARSDAPPRDRLSVCRALARSTHFQGLAPLAVGLRAVAAGCNVVWLLPRKRAQLRSRRLNDSGVTRKSRRCRLPRKPGFRGHSPDRQLSLHALTLDLRRNTAHFIRNQAWSSILSHTGKPPKNTGLRLPSGNTTCWHCA
jgi:hypothetical protein